MNITLLTNLLQFVNANIVFAWFFLGFLTILILLIIVYLFKRVSVENSQSTSPQRLLQGPEIPPFIIGGKSPQKDGDYDFTDSEKVSLIVLSAEKGTIKGNGTQNINIETTTQPDLVKGAKNTGWELRGLNSVIVKKERIFTGNIDCKHFAMQSDTVIYGDVICDVLEYLMGRIQVHGTITVRKCIKGMGSPSAGLDTIRVTGGIKTPNLEITLPKPQPPATEPSEDIHPESQRFKKQNWLTDLLSHWAPNTWNSENILKRLMLLVAVFALSLAIIAIIITGISYEQVVREKESRQQRPTSPQQQYHPTPTRPKQATPSPNQTGAHLTQEQTLENLKLELAKIKASTTIPEPEKAIHVDAIYVRMLQTLENLIATGERELQLHQDSMAKISAQVNQVFVMPESESKKQLMTTILAKREQVLQRSRTTRRTVADYRELHDAITRERPEKSISLSSTMS